MRQYVDFGVFTQKLPGEILMSVGNHAAQNEASPKPPPPRVISIVLRRSCQIAESSTHRMIRALDQPYNRGGDERDDD